MSFKHRVQVDYIFKSKINVIIQRLIIFIIHYQDFIDSSISFINNLNFIRISNSIEKISHIDIIHFNILINCLEDCKIDLDAVKIIIYKNQIEIR